jgi:hypothetical protein
MRNKFKLFIAVGQAALLADVGYCALVFVAFKLAVTPIEQGVLGVVCALLPAGLAAWWIYRKLQKHYTQRESRAAGVAFGVVTPLSFAVAILLAQISGGYAEIVLGGRFILPAVFATVAVVTTLLNFAASAFVLRFTRHLERVQP